MPIQPALDTTKKQQELRTMTTSDVPLLNQQHMAKRGRVLVGMSRNIVKLLFKVLLIARLWRITTSPAKLLKKIERELAQSMSSTLGNRLYIWECHIYAKSESLGGLITAENRTDVKTLWFHTVSMRFLSKFTPTVWITFKFAPLWRVAQVP